MPKPLPEHKDLLGRILNVGDYVAYPDSNQLKIGKIDKLNQKMVRVTTGKDWRPTTNKYPSDTTKLDGPDLTVYLLTRGT
jgi:hypothetical protein